MFDWFWRFLYSISKILFQIIDGMMQIANMLCGIEPIKIDGKETDFLSFMITNDKVIYGFIGAVFIGIFLIMVFSIFAMIKAIRSQTQMTPMQVAIKVIKTLGIFLMVPFVMIAFTKIVNELMKILYNSTSNGSTSMGTFLFQSFLPEGLGTDGAFVNWKSTSSVETFLESKSYDLEDFQFFFSWVCCVPLMFSLAKALMNFVDRTVSIILLFIVSPLSISTSIIDDGSHFKLWRDQVLIKYLTGYGIVIGMNVYILIVSIIAGGNIKFFDDSFLNFLLKLAFILGGAITLDRTMALAGNLVASGAGSNELRDSTGSFNAMAAVATGTAALGLKILKSPSQLLSKGGGGKGEGAGGQQSKDGGKSSILEGLMGGGSSNKNDNKVGGSKDILNNVMNAITGGKGDKGNGGGKENKNNAFENLLGISEDDYKSGNEHGDHLKNAVLGGGGNDNMDDNDYK